MCIKDTGSLHRVLNSLSGLAITKILPLPHHCLVTLKLFSLPPEDMSLEFSLLAHQFHICIVNRQSQMEANPKLCFHRLALQ